MAPALLPELLHIVRGEGYGHQLQRRALQVAHCVVSVLQTLAGSERKDQVRELVGGVARDFLPEFARILAQPTSLHVRPPRPLLVVVVVGWWRRGWWRRPSGLGCGEARVRFTTHTLLPPPPPPAPARTWECGV